MSHALRTPLNAIMVFQRSLPTRLLAMLNPRKLKYSNTFFRADGTVLQLIMIFLISQGGSGPAGTRPHHLQCRATLENALTSSINGE